jgi:phage portal protein BeeE
MNALTKSIEQSRALVNTVHAGALRLKADGLLQQVSGGGSLLSSVDDWQQQSKNRDAYDQFRSWVYAAVNCICQRAIKQPINVARLKGPATASPKSTKGLLLEKMPAVIRAKAEGQEMEIDHDHPLLKVLERPNPEQWRHQFVYMIIAGLNLTGRAYVVRDEVDGETQLFAVPTTWVRTDRSKWPKIQYFVSNPKDVASQGKSRPLDESQVMSLYLPNPSDPLGAISPASSQVAAIRVDDRIQTCQEKHFDNGIFPSWVVTVGKNPTGDAQAGLRPKLTGAQRRQIMGAIRRVLGSISNYGSPAILDGLIESIVPLGRSQLELGWEKSEQMLKTRILSAFGVHPFLLGEPIPVGGYSQSTNIMQVFSDRVNSFLSLLSVAMTHFLNMNVEEGGDRVLVWWEECRASDQSLDWANRKYAFDNGIINHNEFRTMMGLPENADWDGYQLSARALSVITALLPQVGMGAVSPDQLVATLVGCGVDEETAIRIAGPVPESAGPAPAVEPLALAAQELSGAVAALRMEPERYLEGIMGKLRDEKEILGD